MLADVLNPKQQKELKAIMLFKHSKDGQPGAGQQPKSTDERDGEETNAVQKMRRQLYSIPEHLDVDKIKLSREACFADRTATHIKNGLTEVQLVPQGATAEANSTKQNESAAN